MLESVSSCHQGKASEVNKAGVLDAPDIGLWAVVSDSEVRDDNLFAGDLAIKTIERQVSQGDKLEDAVVAADKAIQVAVDQEQSNHTSLITAVAVQIHSSHYDLCWAGKSHAFLLGAGGEISQLTGESHVDDRFAQGDGKQFLGCMGANRVPKLVGEFHDGDTLLLCSHDLTDVLSKEQIRDVFFTYDSLDICSKALSDKCLETSRSPNHILLRYREQTPEIKASDFKHRRPFDQSKYSENVNARPLFLGLVALSILVILFLI